MIDRAGSLNVLALAVFAALVIALPSRSGLIGAPLAQAQNFGQRTVTGTVLDPKSDPVVGAIVFLENQKSKTIRSYSSDNKGHFNFAQVDMTQDFNLWAEKGSRKSAVKVVSSWDSRKEWVGDLKLK
ncbi:MAG TPA: carboxypeptidase-like regulatory domain-containing protein [Terracidiphilus sp.]|nr:carboxypeptidase-like regulatory domain-containing protein [Terracidiphilus sp.]